MSKAHIIDLMHVHMNFARKNGCMSGYMAGYYKGAIDTLAMQAATKEGFDLARSFSAEIDSLREAA